MTESTQGVDSLVMALTTAATTRGIYPPAHPLTSEAMDAVCKELDGLLATQDEISLLVVDDELAVDGKPWQRTSPSRRSLLRALGRAGIESLVVRAGVGRDEVESMVDALSGAGPLEDSFHVTAGHVAVRVGGHGEPATVRVSLETRMDEARDALAELRLDSAGSFDRLERAVWSLIEATAQDSRAFVLLASTKGQDERHWRHAINVCLLATKLGRALGLEGELLHDLGVGALLHDIGYLSLGDGAEASPEEARRRHPQLGAARLAGISDIPALPVLVAYEHHVHWQGGGYPQTTWRPNLATQITAVADSWDTLLNAPGPRSRAVRVERAAQQLRKMAGKVLNPHLVSFFLGTLGLAAEPDS